MTRQTNSLFKPEVYEAMQRILGGSSKYRGAEEAFHMFYADRKIQEFLRNYARKEAIIESPGLQFTQAGEDRKVHVAGITGMYGYDRESPQLFLGPRQNADAALVVYAQEKDLYFPDNQTPIAFRLGEIRKTARCWKIVVPEQIAQDGVGYVHRESYPVSGAPLFQRIGKKEILIGLEKAIESLLKRR